MIHFPLSSDNRIASRILKYIATCWPEMLLQFENNVYKTWTFDNATQNYRRSTYWPRLWHNTYRNAAVNFSSWHILTSKIRRDPLLQISPSLFLLCLTFFMMKPCYFKGKAIFFLYRYTTQLIGFGFLKFGFQFIVLEQYIKSYIYKYIYYILYT